jgi:hypothetical protein
MRHPHGNEVRIWQRHVHLSNPSSALSVMDVSPDQRRSL